MMKTLLCTGVMIVGLVQLAVCSPVPVWNTQQQQMQLFTPRNIAVVRGNNNNQRTALRRQTRQNSQPNAQQNAMAEMLANMQKAAADVMAQQNAAGTASIENRPPTTMVEVSSMAMPPAPSMTMDSAASSAAAPGAAGGDPKMMTMIMPEIAAAAAPAAGASMGMMTEANKVQPLMMMAAAPTAGAASASAMTGAESKPMLMMMVPVQMMAANNDSSRTMMVMIPADMIKAASPTAVGESMMMPSAASQMTMMMTMQASQAATNATSSMMMSNESIPAAKLSDAPLMSQAGAEDLTALPGDSLRSENGIPARLDIDADGNALGLAHADHIDLQSIYAAANTADLEKSYGSPDNTVTDTPPVILPPVVIVREGDMRELLHVLPDEDKQQEVVSNKTINTFSLLQKNISIHNRNTINYLKTLNVNTDYVLNVQRVNHPKTEINTLVQIHNRYVPKLIVKHTRTDRIKELPGQEVPQVVEQEKVEELPPVVEIVQIEREGYNETTASAGATAGGAGNSASSSATNSQLSAPYAPEQRQGETAPAASAAPEASQQMSQATAPQQQNQDSAAMNDAPQKSSGDQPSMFSLLSNEGASSASGNSSEQQNSMSTMSADTTTAGSSSPSAAIAESTTAATAAAAAGAAGGQTMMMPMMDSGSASAETTTVAASNAPSLGGRLSMWKF